MKTGSVDKTMHEFRKENHCTLSATIFFGQIKTTGRSLTHSKQRMKGKKLRNRAIASTKTTYIEHSLCYGESL